MIGGFDSASPPHLLGDSKWHKQYGMVTEQGDIRQIPRFKSLGFLTTGGPSHLVNLPVNHWGHVLYIAITGNGIFQLLDAQNIATKVELLPSDGLSHTSESVFASTIYNNSLFITAEDKDLAYTDGTRITKYDASIPVPRARYIENFYDHLITGWDMFQGDLAPYRVRWSHLYDHSQWVPKPENEADYFDLVEWQLPDDDTFGLTGLKRMDEALVCYLPSALVSCRYIGLPKVMNFTLIEKGIGNSLPYTVASYGNLHFFLDLKALDFFMFDGKSVTSIGGEVKKYLKEFVATNIYLDLVFSRAFVYPEKNQVWFCFTTLGTPKILIYNWKNKSWAEWESQFGSKIITCIGGLAVRAKNCDELTGTADGLSVSCNDLALTYGTPTPRLFGSDIGNVFREDVVADTDASLYSLPTAPHLITGDYYYNDIERVKEIDGVVIHASYTSGSGVEVWLSVRDHLDDAVTFIRRGTWNAALPEGRLSFPARVAGRIFRWKFVPLGSTVRGFTWRAFSESVYAEHAEE